MVDGGGEFSFFQGIHVRTNIRINISISIRSMGAKFGNLVYLGELTQMTQIKQELMTSLHHDDVTN